MEVFAVVILVVVTAGVFAIFTAVVPSLFHTDSQAVCPEHSQSVGPNWPHSSERASTSYSCSTDWRQTERQTGLRQQWHVTQTRQDQLFLTCGLSCWWGQTPAVDIHGRTWQQVQCRLAPGGTETTTGSPASPQLEPAAGTPRKKRQENREGHKFSFRRTVCSDQPGH